MNTHNIPSAQDMKNYLKGMKSAAKNNMVKDVCVRSYENSTFYFSYTELIGYGNIFHVYVRQIINAEDGILTVTHKVVAHNQKTAHNAINYAAKKILNVDFKKLK